VVREFASALSDHKAAEAYALMSPEYRRRVSYEDFRKNLDAYEAELSATQVRLSHVRGPAELRARLHYADGEVLELTQHEGRWYIQSEVLEFYDQSTPSAALHAFVSALKNKRYDVLLRLAPTADKEGLTDETLGKAFDYNARDEIERLLAQLKPHLDDPIEVTGNRATLPYAGNKRVQFVRESGRWCIEDPE
jgi:hypothetical protein